MAKNFRISLGAAGPAAGLPYDAKGNVIHTPPSRSNKSTGNRTDANSTVQSWRL